MTAPIADFSVEFGRRRQLAWRACRWWLLVGVLGFASCWFGLGAAGGATGHGGFTAFLIGFVAFGAGIVAMTHAITKYYRCPACNEIPRTGTSRAGAGGFSYRSGVDLDPTECSHCGARLKAA